MTNDKEKLLFDYGGLLYDFDKSKDIFEKRKIVGKMNVINAILEVPKVEYVSPLLHIVKQIK
jgi:hypothetical protein